MLAWQETALGQEESGRCRPKGEASLQQSLVPLHPSLWGQTQFSQQHQGGGLVWARPWACPKNMAPVTSAFLGTKGMASRSGQQRFCRGGKSFGLCRPHVVSVAILQLHHCSMKQPQTSCEEAGLAVSHKTLWDLAHRPYSLLLPALGGPQ